MDELTAFLNARLDEDEAHAHKDLWAVSRATAQGRWDARYGYNLPHSYLAAEDALPGAYIAEFTSHRAAPPLADGADDLHAADVLLAARMARGAKSRAERVLRDAAAKRAILARYAEVQAWSYPPGDGDEAIQDEAGETVRILAAVYSDHPGYRVEWAP